ncbi:hypothetical protein [Sphingomonas sp. HMP6]|uniref:hypothetical protein n=1 Tax=Sphingomonas sp. HMP6 TaxID=1517551 RepID=UPI00159666FA|nr:hypothetical protein [Sphingomonas sp. HMP6]BCA58982.1 hypothetical protein HMP06_1751 [Sphingomonas sp. HMP6]
MIRSSTAPEAQWIAVPAGFQVAWRNVDLAMFKHRSRVAVRLDAMRQNVIGAAQAVRIGCAVVRWRAVDRLRHARDRMRRRSAYALAVGGRIIRLGPPKPPKQSWNVTVRISFGQDNGLETQRIAA